MRGSIKFRLGSKKMVWVEISAWVAWDKKNGMGSLDFGMGQKVDVGQNQHSLCSVLFHYIVSVPYMYFFSLIRCFFHLV